MKKARRVGGVWLVGAGGSESSGASVGVLEVAFGELSHPAGHDHELGDTLPRLNGLDLVGGVVEDGNDFAPVVGVDDADSVGENQATLDSEAGAGDQEADIPFWNGELVAGMDGVGGTGGDVHDLLVGGV